MLLLLLPHLLLLLFLLHQVLVVDRQYINTKPREAWSLLLLLLLLLLSLVLVASCPADNLVLVRYPQGSPPMPGTCAAPPSYQLHLLCCVNM
jgi:hypothetical protein